MHRSAKGPEVLGPAAAGPRLVIRPTRGFPTLELGELWRFRELLRTLAVRDVKLRYKQTLLGVAWVVLQPLIASTT